MSPNTEHQVTNYTAGTRLLHAIYERFATVGINPAFDTTRVELKCRYCAKLLHAWTFPRIEYYSHPAVMDLIKHVVFDQSCEVMELTKPGVLTDIHALTRVGS